MEYKGYKLESDGTYGYVSIKATGKGSVHKNLRGLYTTRAFAQKDIDSHLNKGDNNGKAKASK